MTNFIVEEKALEKVLEGIKDWSKEKLNTSFAFNEKKRKREIKIDLSDSDKWANHHPKFTIIFKC